MPKYEPLSWYETPLWYDLVFDEDTQKEGAFLEEAVRRFGAVAKSSPARRRVLEPACGSGRLVEEMARRGWSVTGFDASEAMLEFARARMKKARLRAELAKARMEAFRFRGRFELAHCLVSTFKYLLDEESARGHLQCVADALAPGGIYVLGFHLSEYGWPGLDRERWVAQRNGVKVVCNIQSWPPERARRRERVRSRLVVDDGNRVRRTETTWWFRTYDAAQAQRLLRSAPQLEHLATYDFHYDWSHPRRLDDGQLDSVLILRRR